MSLSSTQVGCFEPHFWLLFPGTSSVFFFRKRPSLTLTRNFASCSMRPCSVNSLPMSLLRYVFAGSLICSLRFLYLRHVWRTCSSSSTTTWETWNGSSNMYFNMSSRHQPLCGRVCAIGLWLEQVAAWEKQTWVSWQSNFRCWFQFTWPHMMEVKNTTILSCARSLLVRLDFRLSE